MISPKFFDPTMWAHLGTQLQSSLSNLFTRGIGGAEHFQVPLSMLPANAPFLQQLGMQAGHSIGELNRFSSLGAGLGNNSLGSSFSLNSHMNISSPLDLKKPQFEMGQSSNVHTGLQLDGKMSGPMLSNNPGNTSFLSGTQDYSATKFPISKVHCFRKPIAVRPTIWSLTHRRR